MSKLFLSLLITLLVSPAFAQSEWYNLKSEVQKASQFKYGSESPEILKSIDKYLSNYTSANSIRQKIAYQNEAFNEKFEKTILQHLRMAFENTNIGLINEELNEKMSFSNFADVDALPMREVDRILYAETRNLRVMTGSARAFKHALKEYFNKFHRIEFAEFKLINTESEAPDTLYAEQNVLKAMVHLDVRGISQLGKPRADKATMILRLERHGKNFKITDFIAQKFLTTRLDRTSAFSRMIANNGLENINYGLRGETLRQGGYGFALQDINNDGAPEAFVGSRGEASLWSVKDGSFNKIPAPLLEKLTQAKFAAFVDLDGDGWKDLFVVRYFSESKTGDVVVVKNNNGTFTDFKTPFASGIIKDIHTPVTFADFNNDRLMDVYLGSVATNDISINNEGVLRGIFMNKGGFVFEDPSSTIPTTFSQKVKPTAIMASDFDGDNKIDILLNDNFSRLSPMFQNMGQDKFASKQNEFHALKNAEGVGMASGDFNQDGELDYLLSSTTLNSQMRLAQIKEQGSINNGLRLFLNMTQGRFNEVTGVAGLTDSGEAAAGVSVIDYDNDGLDDIYLANGLWSGTNRDEKIDSLFAMASDLGIAPWGHAVYAKSLVKERIEANKTMSFAGYQRNRLFKNMGNGQFLEVGYLEGVDSQADGYMTIMADINRDNKPDLILRNSDPATKERQYSSIEIFQNRHAHDKGLWITLKGMYSNESAIGAKVYVTVKGKTQVKEVVATHGSLQSESVLHFGIGKAPEADKVFIKWPAGNSETYTAIGPGSHTFIEKQSAIAASGL